MDSWLKSLEQVTALFEASKVNEGKTALSLEESQRELRSLFIYVGLISRSLLTLPLVYCAMLRLVKFTRKNTALSFEESQRKLRSLFDIINGVSDIFLGLFSIDTALFSIDTPLFYGVSHMSVRAWLPEIPTVSQPNNYAHLWPRPGPV